MAGYDDYQTEEEYIAAWKKSAGGEMDTKELVKWLRKIADASRRADGTDIPLGQDLRAANDVIQRMERERDEARKECDKLASAWAANLSSKSETVTALRARLAKMEEAAWFVRDHLAYTLAGPFGTAGEARAIAKIDAALTEEQP